MCFAPEADVVAGAIVFAIGADALRHVRSRREIPLAALPVVFGVHQLSEAFVWWGLRGDVARGVEDAAVWIYLFIAFALLPVFVPIAAAAVERSLVRRRVIMTFGALGFGVAAALAGAMAEGPIHAVIGGRYIEYQLDGLTRGGQLTSLYVVATCGALVASSERAIAQVGLVNFVAIPLLMWLTVGGFVSLWCFWATIVSVAIAARMRRLAREERGVATRLPRRPPDGYATIRH